MLLANRKAGDSLHTVIDPVAISGQQFPHTVTNGKCHGKADSHHDVIVYHVFYRFYKAASAVLQLGWTFNVVQT